MTLGESCFAVSKTCASSARPARRCSTLGVPECMRLPGPAARMTMFTKSGGNSAGCRLSRQLGKTHQRLVDRASALAAFADRPHDERLAAAHVARGENLGNRSDVAAFSIGRRLGVAARVLLDAERLEHGRHRRNKSHREKHEVGFVSPVPAVLEAFGVEKDSRGNAKATTDGKGSYVTSVPKIFAAGDMRRGQSLVVWAIREGRQCARAVDEYLMGFSELPR